MNKTLKMIVKNYLNDPVIASLPIPDPGIYPSYPNALQAALDEFNAIPGDKELVSITDNPKSKITIADTTEILEGTAIIIYYEIYHGFDGSEYGFDGSVFQD